MRAGSARIDRVGLAQARRRSVVSDARRRLRGATAELAAPYGGAQGAAAAAGAAGRGGRGGAGLRPAARPSWATARSFAVRASALTPSCVRIALCAALAARRGALLLLSSVPVLRQQHASTDRVARAARTSFCLAEAEDGRPRFVALATSFESPAASGTHLWALLRLRCCCLSLSKCSGSIAVT